jgi:hypothetical protein
LVYKGRGEDTLNPRGVLERKVEGMGPCGGMRGFGREALEREVKSEGVRVLEAHRMA